MWVRTQDKETLVKADKLYIDKNNNKYTINFDSCTDRWYILGTYKSKERALEVLDEIQTWIERYEANKNNLFSGHVVYKMPEE